MSLIVMMAGLRPLRPIARRATILAYPPQFRVFPQQLRAFDPDFVSDGRTDHRPGPDTPEGRRPLAAILAARSALYVYAMGCIIIQCSNGHRSNGGSIDRGIGRGNNDR